MKHRLGLLAVVLGAVALALVGVLRDSGTSNALMPLPISPYAPSSIGGLSTTQLGANVAQNSILRQAIRGERVASPFGYIALGTAMKPDKDLVDNVDSRGSIYSELDALCDSTSPANVDFLATAASVPPNWIPFPYLDQTTAVSGTSESFLQSVIPPFPWLARERGDLNNVWLFGSIAFSIPVLPLNVVFLTIPWSPNSALTTSASYLGGSPDFPTPAAASCTDSPQVTTSIGTQTTNPPAEGDSGAPCDAATKACVDASVYGPWAQGIVNVATGTPATVAVNKVVLNHGPEDGAFSEHWEVMSTAANITANWSGGGAAIDEAVTLSAGSSTSQSKNLQIACSSAGEGLVVIKNILWPVPIASGSITQPTVENYPDDNAGKVAIRVVCDSTPGSPLVDKQVIHINPTGVTGADFASTPTHIELLKGGSATLSIDELKSNPSTSAVDGKEWLVAEVSDVDGVVGNDISVAWINSSVEVNGAPVTASDCAVGDDCVTFTASEPTGQSDVTADITVACPADVVEGSYSVVLKAVDAPTSPNGEALASNNVALRTIKVWCWASSGNHSAAQDGIDDAAGLYATFTGFNSSADLRKPFKSPPSFPSDTDYRERFVDDACYWMDDDGCPTCDADSDGTITPAESMNDPDLVALGGIATIDPDGDCLPLPQYAQPGRPVDDASVAGTCSALPWLEAPASETYTKNQDADCDGLIDSIERTWGSNTQVADTDSDGSEDFAEFASLTNPVNPDTDGDGLRDKPEDDYIAAAAGAAESGEAVNADDNCPFIYNPDQANNDGKRRANGAVLPGSWASNPNQDKMGDACDPDDDNDKAVDAAEATKGTNPMNPDSDGDRCLDGVEGYLGVDPLLGTGAGKCPGSLSTGMLVYSRACRWNVVQDGYDGGLWDAEYDGTNDGVEWDADGDGLKCQIGSSIVDLDNDNGKGVGVAPDEISDNIEIKGYGTMAANKDTDGDGCDDWVEIADVNGDRVSNIIDVQWVAKRVFNVVGASDSDPIFDLDKNGAINVLDVQLEAKNSSLVKANNCVPYPEG